MQRHMKRLHHVFRDTPAEHLPLVPTDDGNFASKSDIMKLFSSAIALTDTPLYTRLGPHGEPLPRLGERVCRVSGAQFLSRMGYSLEAIQLIGCWGSNAVKRYIQEAPLAATPSHMIQPNPQIYPNWFEPSSLGDATPGGSLANTAVQPTFQRSQRQPRTSDGELMWLALRLCTEDIHETHRTSLQEVLPRH